MIGERLTAIGVSVALALALFVGCAQESELSKESTAVRTGRPNVLLVVVDDMGWTDVGAFGSEIETPHIDALAERGVRFTDFHVSVSCSPTRSMLLSGTDNHIAGLGNMGELLTPNQRGKPGYEGHLNNRVVSLAEVLRDGGYHTYMGGKWHLGHEPEYYPHARGFERSLALLYGGASHWADMSGLIEAESPAHYAMNAEKLDQLPADFYSSRSYADFLMESIRENRDDGKPFFAYLAFTAPHDPLHVPEPWLSKYRSRYDEGYEILKAERAERAKRLGLVPEGAPTPGRLPMVKEWNSLSEEEKRRESRSMEVYAGMIENLDYHYGRVVNFLKDIGEYDNTMIIFFSDNGANPWVTEDYPGNRGSAWLEQFDNSVENLGHPGSAYAYGIGWASASAGPLQRFKMTVAEGGIRSPLVVAGPGVKGNRIVEAFSYVTDIMPTILELAGLEHPGEYGGRKVEPISGRSMAGVLSGGSQQIYDASAFVGGEMGNGKWMRQGNLKAVSISKPYGPAQWQLFDVAKDPGETRDLSKEQPEMLKKLQAAWDQYAKDVGVVPSQ